MPSCLSSCWRRHHYATGLGFTYAEHRAAILVGFGYFRHRYCFDAHDAAQLRWFGSLALPSAIIFGHNRRFDVTILLGYYLQAFRCYCASSSLSFATPSRRVNITAGVSPGLHTPVVSFRHAIATILSRDTGAPKYARCAISLLIGILSLADIYAFTSTTATTGAITGINWPPLGYTIRALPRHFFSHERHWVFRFSHHWKWSQNQGVERFEKWEILAHWISLCHLITFRELRSPPLFTGFAIIFARCHYYYMPHIMPLTPSLPGFCPLLFH